MYNLIKLFAADSADANKNGLVTVQTVGNGNSGLSDSVTSILSAIIGSLGLVAVVVMIIGGYNYMTSSGDAAKVEKAKKTVLYGLIGLIICVLAFVIVNFVIANILGQGTAATKQ